MFTNSATADLHALTIQDVLGRLVAQERENSLLRAELRRCEAAAAAEQEKERCAYMEVDAALREVVRLCLSCAASGRDGVVVSAVVQQLERHIDEEVAAAESFALEVRHERVALLARRAAERAEKGGGGVCRNECIERAADEAVAQQERMEIMRVEQQRVDLERRTEVAALQYARELFGVHVD